MQRLSGWLFTELQFGLYFQEVVCNFSIKLEPKDVVFNDFDPFKFLLQVIYDILLMQIKPLLLNSVIMHMAKLPI